jgi:uncharacterized membrane protein YgdD (TMEM256/DUF423 family)
MNAEPHRDRFSYVMISVAALLGGLGVIIGAFGAHGLEAQLTSSGVPAELIPKRLDQFDVGARYHLVHAVAIFALANASILSRRCRMTAFVCFTAGILLFSGSLYVLVLTNTPWLGAITPLGGVAWIIAWFVIAISAFLSARKPSNA